MVRSGAMRRGPAAVEILPAGPLSGTVVAPASKSVTNRVLAISALASGRSEIVGPLASDDTAAMAAGLTALGAPVEVPSSSGSTGGSREPSCWRVSGTGGLLRAPAAGRRIDARESGTTLRFLAALALLADGPVVLDGSPGLRRRPMKPLLRALESLGAAVSSSAGRPPIEILGGGIDVPGVAVDAACSSQFATAVLLVAPYASGDLTVEIANLHAAGYVDLTLEQMRLSGAVVHERGQGRFEVSANHRYVPRRSVVEHDASAAAHLYALSVATSGAVKVANARPTCQPDSGVLDLFSQMGARVEHDDLGGTTVRGPERIGPLDADLSKMPDQLPTVAALCALSAGRSRLSGLAVARGHETDRVSAVATELRRLGAVVSEGPDSLEISGGRTLQGTRVRTYGDHRMAMALTAVGAAVGGVVITDPSCVTKTYPSFFEDAGRLGLGLRPET